MCLEGEILSQHMIEDAVQSAAGHLGAAAQLETAAGGIARVGKGLLAYIFFLCIEGVESLVWHKYLAADLKLLRPAAALERAGYALDGEHIVYDIVALDTVAAGHGLLELSAHIGQADSHAVELELAGILRVGAVLCFYLGAESEHILFAVGVAQRQHRVAVFYLLELGPVGIVGRCLHPGGIDLPVALPEQASLRAARGITAIRR